MAATDMTMRSGSGKTVPAESGYGAAAPARVANFFRVDFSLRLLMFASALSGLVVLVTSKETEFIPTSLPPPYPTFVPWDADFKHSPAFIYLLAALSVTCLYSIITIITSFFLISNPSPSTRMLFNLILMDALMAGVMASATGAGGSVAYIGLRGNSHVRWNKICNVYGKFCRYVGGSVLVSLLAAAVLVMLVILSSYSLYRRSR